ncbi:unnamed protein product [Cercopithifilaria johnstoni]|uniref:Uncharacterized protein n=1 Tax=Cercopithifilaria johnstoni TaxID=2874296 RepID=A0A8J2Q6E7_9BILA|nr:unnamed protein product [Cercopithifilaria johnstoni]
MCKMMKVLFVGCGIRKGKSASGWNGQMDRLGVIMRSEHLKCVNVAESAKRRKEGIPAIASVKTELAGNGDCHKLTNFSF